MSMRRFFFDTAVFLYALGRDHAYRVPCRRLVTLASDGQLRGEASVELLQEFAHVRARRSEGSRADVARETRDVAALCRLHEVTEADLDTALRLFRDTPRLGMRDAVHAASALNRGVDLIVSPDRAFDEVVGLARVDPVDAEAALLG